MFIEITDTQGVKVIINTDHIVAISKLPDVDNPAVFLVDGKYYKTKETYAQLKKLLLPIKK